MPFPIKNRFIVAKGTNAVLSNSYKHNIFTGQSELSGQSGEFEVMYDLSSLSSFKEKLYIIKPSHIHFEIYQVAVYNTNTFIKGFDMSNLDFAELDSNASHVILNIKHSIFSQQKEAEFNEQHRRKMATQVWAYFGIEAVPHYKTIKIQNKRENEQIFFRESIDGNISLFGRDYDFVDSQGIESEFIFSIIDSNNKLISTNTFVKPDCKWDFCKKRLQLKLSPKDRYSNIVNRYGNTYDLIKCAPPVSQLTLTKRMAYQIYIQGGKSLSVFSNGSYYEDEVSEPVDDENKLKNKYHFALNNTFTEISINRFDDYVGLLVSPVPAINGTYQVADNSQKAWMSSSGHGFIRLRRQRESALNDRVYNLSDGSINDKQTQAYTKTVYYIEMYDADRIPGKLDENTRSSDAIMSECRLVYTSERKYDIATGGVVMSAGADYPMRKSGTHEGPDKYNLGEDVIEYKVWARVLADIDRVTIGGKDYKLYDLPYDDFATTRANYKKCIGIIALSILQSSKTVKYATKFGMNDSREYFTSNAVPGSNILFGKPMPVCRSTWANTSIWAFFSDNRIEPLFRKPYTIKDTYSIGSVIKALLSKVDPSIKHEETEEYSQFLYGSRSPLNFDFARNGCKVFIAPKSNILKGNYDQAAQKAEITLEQVMNMLKSCFRCYWFVEDNKLKIEHISYFMNGRSYSQNSDYIDLTNKIDKFNKKNVLYGQGEISYSKSDLPSRYEFGWMDDSSEIFEDVDIDINSLYIQADKTENISAGVFTSDVDLMLLAPEKFSNDGFALLVANSNNKVPIVNVSDLRDDEFELPYSATPQNYLASWLYMIRYYMLDMPDKFISYQRAPLAGAYRVTGLKRCMSYSIEVQNLTVDLYKSVKTKLGQGYIDSVTKNIDTNMVEMRLNYEPK